MKTTYCIFFIFAFTINFFGCKARGPVTPEESFAILKKSYFNSDNKTIAKLLSKNSLLKMTKIKKDFSSMNDSQIESLSQYFKAPAADLKNLSNENFIKYFFIPDLEKIAKYEDFSMQKILREKDSAVVLLKNGAKLNFIQEGPYWMLDISNF